MKVEKKEEAKVEKKEETKVDKHEDKKAISDKKPEEIKKAPQQSPQSLVQ